MNLNYNKKVLIGVALVLYILYKVMGGWLAEVFDSKGKRQAQINIAEGEKKRSYIKIWSSNDIPN